MTHKYMLICENERGNRVLDLLSVERTADIPRENEHGMRVLMAVMVPMDVTWFMVAVLDETGVELVVPATESDRLTAPPAMGQLRH